MRRQARARGRMAAAVGLVIVGLWFAWAPGRADVPAEVRAELAAGGEAEVLVVLKDRADLSAAAAQPTKAARGRAVVEALRATAAAGQGPLLAFLEARGAEYRPFYVVNAVWVRAGEELVAELARRPDVAAIAANPRVRGVDLEPAPEPAAVPPEIQPNLLRINADDVWSLGYTGQGVVVAGQDTGYRWTHQALKEQYRGWDGVEASHDYNWHDAIHSGGGICGADSPAPCDDHGHGTHTMGIMVGADGTTQIGVAPGAEWIGCRNMDVGVGTPATYMECFEFFLAPYPLGGKPEDGDPALAPDVVNNSWGCPPGEGCDAKAIAALEESVEALRAAGIVVVASAGNYGPSCATVDDPPAIYPGSFTVGNFYHVNDTIAGSSSRGPVTYGSQTYVKPDLAAPGTAILSSYNSSDSSYFTMSGTSMAAPHVAGAVALLLSAGPGLAGDVEGIEELLARAAEPKLDASCGDAGPPNNVWGWGIVDALGSVGAGLVRGRAVEAGSELPLAGALVTAEAQALLAATAGTTTDISGTFSLVLPAGPYTLAVDARCYGPAALAVEAAAAGVTSAGDVALPAAPCTYLPLVLQN